jgi:hypothetical protein
LRPTPHLEDQVSHSPYWQGGHLYPQAPGSLSVTF